jgi:CRISPR/Cas system CMR-associated protein Cmr5 small subunit
MKLYVTNVKPIKSKKHLQRKEHSPYKVYNQDEFLKARERAKETIGKLKQQGVKEEIINQLFELAKNDYSRKIEQLLVLSEENEQSIIAAVEENYEVKVMTG